MTGIFIAAYSFVASVIGAGFASGQEILSFFNAYGKWGILGIFLAAGIIGWFAFFVLSICTQEGIEDYNIILSRLMSKKMMTASRMLTIIFLICSYSAMIACFGEMMYMIFDISKLWASVIFTMICATVICMGADRALKLNGILGIITVTGIIAAVLYLLRFREHQTMSNAVSSVVSGAGYSGYNLIGAGVILTKLSKNIKTRNDALLTGIIISVALAVMMGLIYWILSIYHKYINLGEVPMLTLAMRENKAITYFYFIMLVLAVVTTAVSDGVGINELMNVKPSFGVITSLIALAVSGAGFSNVINIAYRVCGYLGSAIIIYIIINLKKLKKSEKRRKTENKLDI